MKKNLSLVFFCFLAGLAGGNVSPILTGSGFIKFPETSPSASISASGGTLTLAAGGTNQNILLKGSGTGGVVGVNTTNPTFGNTLFPAVSVLSSSTLFAGAYSTSQPVFALNAGSDGSWSMYDYAAGGWVASIFANGGRIGIKAPPNVNYQLDVTGDINTSSQYRVGGVIGLGVVKTIRNSAGTGTCTMTFSGGILTASTC